MLISHLKKKKLIQSGIWDKVDSAWQTQAPTLLTLDYRPYFVCLPHHTLRPDLEMGKPPSRQTVPWLFTNREEFDLAMEERPVIWGRQENYISEIRIDEELWQEWTFFKCNLAWLISLKHRFTPLYSHLNPSWVSPKHSNKRRTTVQVPDVLPFRFLRSDVGCCLSCWPTVSIHHCRCLTPCHPLRMEELTGLLESRVTCL